MAISLLLPLLSQPFTNKSAAPIESHPLSPLRLEDPHIVHGPINHERSTSKEWVWIADQGQEYINVCSLGRG